MLSEITKSIVLTFQIVGERFFKIDPPVVLGEELVDVALDDAGLPTAQFPDHQHLEYVLCICSRQSHPADSFESSQMVRRFSKVSVHDYWYTQ